MGSTSQTVATSWRASAFTVLSAVLLTRLLLVATGLTTLAWQTPDVNARRESRSARPASPPIVDMWARWDADWYLDIVRNGFRPAPPGGPYWMQPNFFPLYPLSVRVVARLTGSDVAAGVLVSNAALVAALCLLHAWTWRRCSKTVADRAVWIYGSFPTSFFLSAIYAESMLLATIVGAWWFEDTRRRRTAGIALALAVLTRPVGVFAAPPLAGRVVAAVRRGEARVRDLAVLVTPPILAVFSYLAFAHVVYGNALATVVTQTDSRGPTGWPWAAFARLWEEGPAWHGWANSILDAVLAVGALSLLPMVWKRLGRAEAVFAASVVLFPLGSGLISFSRLVLPAFPLFVVLATGSRAWPSRALVGAGLTLQVVLFTMYVGWRWVA